MGDAGRVLALELGEAGGVECVLVGALGAGFFDGFVGEETGGDEDGCHCLFRSRWRERASDGVGGGGFAGFLGMCGCGR